MSGNKRGRKRRFGSVRKLPSGRFQARYPAPDGTNRTAPETFETQTEAEQWLVKTEADQLRDEWLDPNAGKMPLRAYATRWMKERTLKPRTREEYERIFRLHVFPQLGDIPVNEVTPSRIRSWRADLLDNEVGKSTVAKAYRIVKAVFTTVVDEDELMKRNPCRIKGAGQDKAEERPVATLQEVFAIAAAIQPRYRLLVLFAAFAQLRFSELVNLRRHNLRLSTMELRVRKVIAEMEDGTQLEDDPKSEAGKRRISLPNGLRADVELHLASYAMPGQDGRLFPADKGTIPRRRNFNRVWKKAIKEAGIKVDLHLHDLRHTGSTLVGRSASLKELMARIGHSSTRAAMNYQHATRERDHAIAEALDDLIKEAREQESA